MNKILFPVKDSNNELIIKLNNFTIRGKSKGGCETSLIIEELNTAFDMGCRPEKVESLMNVFISHGHIDHIGCLHYCHATKYLNHNYKKWQLILPSPYIEPYKLFVTTASTITKGGYPINYCDCTFHEKQNENLIDTHATTIKQYDKFMCDIIQADDLTFHDLIENNKYCVSSHKMQHKILSYGYTIYEKRKKLKEEYFNLPKEELIKLRKSGMIIQNDINVPVISFTGDTLIEPLLSNSDMLNSKILMMECTHFNDEDKTDAIKNGHIHFSQFLENITSFKNEWIILCHFSQKYRSKTDLQIFLDKIPEEFANKIIAWI